MSRLVTLERWAEAEFGDDAPKINTLRKWAREGRFSPPAERPSKLYYVTPDAKLLPPQGRRRRLVERIHVAAPQKRA